MNSHPCYHVREMPGQIQKSLQSVVKRSFRELTKEQIDDRDLLSSMESFGLGKVLDWSEILEFDRVLVLSAAGAGKTYECQSQAIRLSAEGKPAFFFALEGLSSSDPETLLSPAQVTRFRTWLRDGQSTGYFFLDSVDELQLSHGNFGSSLRALASAIDGALHRAKIVVTSRPIHVDRAIFSSELPYSKPNDEPEPRIEERFQRLISGETQRASRAQKNNDDSETNDDGIRSFALTLLSNDQITQIVTTQGVQDSVALLAEIEQKRAWDFARRPQELIEICAYWKENGRLGTRAEQVAEDIRRKLGEAGTRKKGFKVSEKRALDGAERLALAIVLTRKRSIRVSDLSLDELEKDAALDPSIILADWSEGDRTELLQRALFGFASYGRVRFHHRSATEFLAAKRLNQLVSEGHMPRRSLFRLLFGERYGEKFVFPSMRAVAVWLSLSDEHVRSEMLAREPEALMDDGDPESFAVSTRNTILSTYVNRYRDSNWRGIRISYPQVLRFACPQLSPTVKTLWRKGANSPEVKELLIDLIYAGRMADCIDIASEIARDSNAVRHDRVTAISALAEMTEAGKLGDFVESLIDPNQDWPSQLKESVIDALFPKHMSVAQLVSMLAQIEHTSNRAGGLNWTLPRLIPEMALAPSEVSVLRQGISDLIRDSIRKVDAWPYFQSEFCHLASALAVLCSRELQSESIATDDLIESAVMVWRFKQSEYGDEKPTDELATKLHADVTLRPRIYAAESAFCIAHIPSKDSDDFVFNVTHGGLINQLIFDDFVWLSRLCQDRSRPQLTRGSAFRDALRLTYDAGKPLDDRIEQLRAACTDNEKWQKRLDEWVTPRTPDRDYEAQEAKWAAESLKRKETERKAVATWERWRKRVIANPDRYFEKTKVERVCWDFYQVLERHERHVGQRVTWDSALLTEFFSEAIAVRVRDTFKSYWRTIKVPLRSEKAIDDRNTVWSHWMWGMAGVYAETELGPDWAKSLSRNEAEIAARYVPVELNGVPPWVADLVAHQPEAADATLGQELSAQLEDALSFNFPDLVSDFSRADNAVQHFFAPRVWQWLSTTPCAFEDETGQARMHEHLERAIEFRLRHPPEGNDTALIELARGRLENGFDAPFSLLWFSALLRLDPAIAIETLDDGLNRLSENARYEFSERLFAALGERRNACFASDLSDPRFTPDLLRRLVRVAYAEIKLERDINRADGGAYSPTPRDDAQQGRGAVLGALLSRTGPEAWRVKQEMRSEPLLAHFKDRLNQIARETAAGEAEGPSLHDADLVNVEKYGDAPEADRDGMFQLMLDRLSDLQHDISAHEFTERPILLRIDKEAEMQVWFAKRLQDRANGAYKVDREAMVVNAKETDIRLLSVRTSDQAVIEIKLANNGYSVTDFLTALEVQLVGQYMQHDTCRAGCLLITMAEPRTWKHPDDGTSMSFAAVIDLLKAKAKALVADMNYSLCLEVVGIDFSAS